MRRTTCFLLWVLALGALAPPNATASPPLDVVLVQYRVAAEDYASLDSFRERITAVVAEAVAQSQADLIVFPEYTSVFALFTEFIASGGEVELEGISPQVVALMSADDDQDRRAPAAATAAAQRLVRRQAQRFGTQITEIWSAVAAEYEVWIMAGSGFVPAPEGGVNNRVWVFDRAGKIAYDQDKVFLTDFERENLGVVPGAVSEADTFVVEGIELAVTICRDSYFDAWEQGFSDADAWIDVRANGEEYSQAVRRRFDTALPERVAETSVPMGLSTSLNGRFLDLLWQGPAFVVEEDGDRIVQAPTVDGNYLMVVQVPDVTPEARISEENSVD